MPDQKRQVTIYTDGGCRPNPGLGAWGAVLLFDGDDAHPQEYAGSQPDTTNNRMELQAAIEALRVLRESCRITIVTDSKYLQNGVTQWMQKWVKNGWQTSLKEPVKNSDLWKELQQHLARHDISWSWTKGHAGDRWNERADELAGSFFCEDALPVHDSQAIHIHCAAVTQPVPLESAFVAQLRYRSHQKLLDGHIQGERTDRAMLRAAVTALLAVKKVKPVHIYTASSYLHDGIAAAVRNEAPGRDEDLWQELVDLCRKHQVSWHLLTPSDDAIKSMTACARRVLAGLPVFTD